MLKLRPGFFFLSFFILTSFYSVSQIEKGLIAKFSFNDKSDRDEITKHRAKLVGAAYTTDRFGNDNNAVYLSGNKYTYINLGNYNAIKPKTGTISLWIKMENRMWSGKGAYYNPIILTKCADLDDFYEAYGVYYFLETQKLGVVSVQDSTRESDIFSREEFTRNNWHHLVISYTYDNFKFYIDGELQGVSPKKFETTFLPSDSVVIGTTANAKNDRFLNAAVDDVEFYGRELTEGEVLDLFHAPNPNKYKTMLFWAVLALGFIVLVVGIYLFISYRLSITYKKEKAQLELHNKLLETELRANRAMMNPHFIFNSLNALQNFILKSNIEGAIDYLAKFSKLIRKILESNLSESVSLAMEIELIKGYLDIENLRFKEKIQYEINVDPAIMPHEVAVPVIILQPFIENAIWHGFQKKEGQKILRITFRMKEKDYLYCEIEDNGTGRNRTEPAGPNKSLGTLFVQQRLEMLNKIYDLKSGFVIEDKPDHQGTIVKIILPVLNDKIICPYVQL
jgi:two-component sensor histidine kinase